LRIINGFLKKNNMNYSVLIFGGGRGIGKIISRHFIKANRRISAASRNFRLLEELKRESRGPEKFINIIEADIRNEIQVKSAFESHKSFFGDYPAIVINTAAIQGPIGHLWELSSEEWTAAVNIDLLGGFFITKAAIAAMLPEGKGSIIHFSGGGSTCARPNFSAYAAAKTGLLRLVENAAEELRISGHKDIIINAVAPGAVKTGMMDEIIRSADTAGAKEKNDAENVLLTGGTPPELITGLVDFLCDPDLNKGISGRLIHVREDYIKYAEKFGGAAESDDGKLRRVPLI